jgi:CheY-like chemotaxis protein
MWRNTGRVNLDVLLIEDNPVQILLLQEILEESGVGMDLRVSEDGEAALASLRGQDGKEKSNRPDLIMLDLNLPGMDGFQILKEIKEDRELQTIPVIVLSTSQADEDIRQCYRLGANCYIIKPVDLDEFIKVIRAIESFWCHTARLPTE